MSKILTQKVEEVRKKVVYLLAQNQRLVSKNEELEVEVQSLKQTLETETQKSNELLNKIKIIKLAQNIGSSDSESSDVTELKRKVNEYIKEIDHCIAMLND